MTITYEEALSTLQSMFSHQGYSPQQLDAVLRHHGGHMEHTVETVLSHGEGSPEELMAKLKDIPADGSGNRHSNGGGGGGSGANMIDADEELARQLAAEDQRQHGGGRASGVAGTRSVGGRPSSSASPQGGGGIGLSSAMGFRFGAPAQRRPAPAPSSNRGRTTGPAGPVPSSSAAAPPSNKPKGRGTPTTLPVDFLRIPGRKYPASGSYSTPMSPASQEAMPGGTMMTDEQLARMLQDELFQEELRNNPEFSHLAGRRNNRAANTGGVGSAAHMTGRSNFGGVGWNERTDFFDRLSELGDNAKRRFQELAANWGDPNRQNQRGRGGFGVNRGNERRGLLDGDLNMEEEEEMEFVGGNGGDLVELGDVRGSGAPGSKKKD